MLNQLIFAWDSEADRAFGERDRLTLKGFLADRWAMVARTNADYFMNPHGRLTKVLEDLAKYVVGDLFTAVRSQKEKIRRSSLGCWRWCQR